MSYTMCRTWPDDPRGNPDDYVIRCDGRDVGRMYRTIGINATLVWHWTIYGTNKAGREPTLEAAKAKWRKAFEAE